MALRDLPEHPDLDQLKRQAKELLQGHRDGKLSAAGRIVGHHPKLRDRPPTEVLSEPFTLAEAQLTLAREYGYLKLGEAQIPRRRGRTPGRHRAPPGLR
jgi:hypothetical protein